MDSSDLPELFDKLSLKYLNIVPIKRNSFFVRFKDEQDLDLFIELLDGFILNTI